MSVIPQSRNMETGQSWRQYFVAAIANIAIASTGYCMGWTSPIFIKLGNRDGPLALRPDEDQLAWIGSLLTVGAIFGPFLGGFIAPRVGRRWGLLLSAIPLFIGWVLVTVGSTVALLYAGRFFWGIAVGMLFTITPMYCSEIATDDCRGALGSFLQGSIVIGYLLVYLIGPFVSYRVISYVGIAYVAVFCLTFYFMPETPIYHLCKNDKESAAESLMMLRGKSRTDVQDELDKMAVEVEASMQRTAKLVDVFRGTNFKAFYISCALVFFQQFCGITAVLFYLTTIFDSAGTTLDASIATIIVGIVQVIGSCITPFVVDRLGRRVLYMISSCGTAVGLGLLGMFFVLASNDSPVVESIGFLPVLSLMLFILTYCLGLGPLPWPVISELFPIEVKTIATPIATAVCWISAFIVSRYFSTVVAAVGTGVAFFIFAGFCVTCFFFTLFVLPETKGRSLQEIQELLAGKSLTPEKA